MTRILVDATALPADRGGVGRYVDALLPALAARGADVHVAAQSRDTDRYEAVLGRSHVHSLPGVLASAPARMVWEQTLLPRLASRLSPDAVLSPHYTMPLVPIPGARRVVTLHDATFFSDPELHDGPKAPFFRAWTRLSGRRADHLVVPSEATRSELARLAGVAPERMSVVPHGVDHTRFRPPTAEQVQAVRAHLELGDRPFIAFLGTLEPRKNVPALIRAYVDVCAGRSDPPALILAGGRGWDDGVDPALAAVPERLDARRVGFVPDELVPALLGAAEVVAYPALGEGFGLPVLEAMACGACVLTTRRLSLPEVGGDAVAYADSPDTADLAVALTALLDDTGRRQELGRAAAERAATYTWDRAARQHLEVFEGAPPHHGAGSDLHTPGGPPSGDGGRP